MSINVPFRAAMFDKMGAVGREWNLFFNNLANNFAPFGSNIPLLADSFDTSKQVEFNLGGLSPGTTRTITVPDKDFTIAGLDDIPTQASGSILQSVTAAYATYSNHTTQIPTDDTIPQNTEGDQILTVSITPVNAANTLCIRVGGLFLLSGAGAGSLAIFRDAMADAIYAASMNTPGTEYISIYGEASTLAGATASTDFKVRIGPNAAVTMYANGSAGNRIFGGVAAWRITVEEIKA